MQKTRFVVLLHNCGDHSQCGKWCRARRAKKEGKPYNVKPTIDCNTKIGMKRIIDVYEILCKYTDDESLIEMLHDFDTQLNESLNMRTAETVPKSNNFSVKVVFPASGCEIIPNVLLRLISSKKLINEN